MRRNAGHPLMEPAWFSASLACLPAVWSLPPKTATSLLSVSHFIFHTFLGSLLLGLPVSPFASSHPAPSLDSGVPACHVVPWGHCTTNPAPHHPSAFSPFHPITLRLLASPFSSSRPCLPDLSPSVKILGKRVGERRGAGIKQGRGLLDVVQTEKDRWKK